MWPFKKTNKEVIGFEHVVFYAFIGVLVGILIGLFFGFVIGALSHIFTEGGREMADSAKFFGMSIGAVIGSLLGGATALKKR